MVETYFQQELSDVCFEVEALNEWNELNKELGFTEQLKFTESSSSPVPYPWLNSNLIRVFETLCPMKVEANKYNKTPIPLDVLKALAYCKKENFFTKFEIMYDDKILDPLLIGIITSFYGYMKIEGQRVEIRDDKSNYMYFTSKETCQSWCMTNNKEFHSVTECTWGDNYKRYLIARWGDVLRPMAELKNIAKERIIEKYGADIKNTIKDCQIALEKLNENAILFLNGEMSESKLKGVSQW